MVYNTHNYLSLVRKFTTFSCICYSHRNLKKCRKVYSRLQPQNGLHITKIFVFYLFKVHIFWGHKILRNLHLTFVLVKSKVKISQNFVAFSEHMNFTMWLQFCWPRYYQILSKIMQLILDALYELQTHLPKKCCQQKAVCKLTQWDFYIGQPLTK